MPNLVTSCSLKHKASSCLCSQDLIRTSPNVSTNKRLGVSRSSWRSIIDMQLARSKGLTTDRSVVRFLSARNCSRPTQLVKVERSIQTLIFNQQSAYAAFCPRSYYFIRPEPLKITKSASSSTPSQEKDRRFNQQSKRGSAVGIRTRHASSSGFSSRHVAASFKSLSITVSPTFVNPLFSTGYSVLRSGRTI
jgi:hypothetical protein